MNIKKISASLLAIAMLAGCGSSDAATTTATEEATSTEATAAVETAENTQIDKLTFMFVPSRDPELVIEKTKALPELIKGALADHGYDVNEVEVLVSESYEAAGEALAAGSAQVAWLPGGTYALYSDDVDVVLTATRAGLSNDSTNPSDWNGEENATRRDGDAVTYYRGLIYAGPSEYGQQLAAKVNAGEELTWEDLDGANWGLMNATSSAGYIYPTLWLMDNYDGKQLTDLSHASTLDGYATAFSQVASEQLDVIMCYADGRNDYESIWNLPADEQNESGQQGFGREDSIWNELNVIGVTDGIYNDTVAVTKADDAIYNDTFEAALQDAILDLAETEEGMDIFSVYSHSGYAKATDADYDSARAALSVITE